MNEIQYQNEGKQKYVELVLSLSLSPNIKHYN